MANIIAYPLATPKASDLLVGTQVADPNIAGDTNKTRNFKIEQVAAFANTTAAYTAYSALISQDGILDPTAILLQNNTGATMTWTRTGIGVYRCTASFAVFTNLKTQVFVNVGTAPNGPGSFVEWNAGTDYVEINTYDITGAAGDALLDKGSLEIRIYA